MTDSRHRRQPPGPLLSLLIEGTPLVWAALVCAAVYYGLGIRPALPVFESTQDSTRCVLVSPPGAADIRAWERNLYDWAALRDPALLVLPNERLGFSRERFARLEVPSAPVPAYRFTMTPLGQSAAPPLALCGPPMGLAERLAAIVEPIRPPPVAPLVAVPLARGIFWRTLDGRLVDGLPAFDEREVRAAVARQKPPTGPTTLRLVHGDRLATTRVQLLLGCGNAELDALAVVALRRAAGQQQLRESQKDAVPVRAGFFPPPGDGVELQVEWSPVIGPAPAPGTP